MKSGYSSIDRFVHRLALGNLAMQKLLADMENHFHAALLRQIPVERPVFITSLPRAGTTLLLDVLFGTGGFASQTYRDMPFVLCPLLWHAVSCGFQRNAEARERAHGDGRMVGYDSAEAFEEVLWKAYWPQKYAPGHVLTWSAADRDVEFEEAFANHMRKVIAARAGGAGGNLRYLSKNNANVARLPLLAEVFPDCTILIPFRNPVDQAGSLAAQHANFLAKHAQDRFTKTYMEWIGHHQFGPALRPIAFPDTSVGSSIEPDFWLSYWDRAFRHILRNFPPQAVLIDYDELCENPDEGLRRITDALGIPDSVLRGQAPHFRRANRHAATADLRFRADIQDTYSALRRKAVEAAVRID